MFSSQKRGITMIEALIAIGVVGLILIVWMWSLYSKQAENRDLKRVSDIQSLRQAMAVIKSNNGFYDRALCELGAVSGCAGKSGSALLSLMPQLADFTDPKTPGTACANAATCQAGSCNYAFTNLAADSYEILFYLEKGVNGFSEPGCYSATPQGIRKY